ncbi:MAG: flagellar biosynthesis protein FlhA [Planctomycetota bacterium]|nr:flagellar biosynthesis protein FlhA [Planctomycetota bacterium]
MASAVIPGLRELFTRHRALLFPVLIVASVMVIIAPLPPILMDLLLAANITIAVIILLTTIHVSRPLEFSVFPSILLGTTLARLVLNVASTRLILSRAGEAGTRAAGGVIEAFGQFVAGGNLVIGLIIFIILVAIQFLVITKGATRVSEVAARFALDGMPGKQMAIDADLNAQLITQEEAKRRREEVTQQADFYGAMDGSSKFVRGDSIAGIVITLVNIVGGLYVGVVDHGMDVGEAAKVFTTLTIGDGLVTQVPAFLISLAAGLIVTRTSAKSDLPSDVVTQLFRHPVAMYMASAFVTSLAFTGLPMLPLLALGTGCGLIGFSLQNSQKVQAAETRQEQVKQARAKPEPKPEDRLFVDPMELELGLALLGLADPNAGGDLMDRVTRVRNKIAQELGILLPKVRMRDNITLDRQSYQIKIRDVPVAWGMAYANGFLAIDTGATNGTIPGIDAIEPAFGRPARWIEESQKERAELMGFNVVEPSAVVITHLTEVVRDHSHELLTRQHVHQLLDNLKENSSKVVEELDGVLKTSHVHQVLASLLKERVPIRDLETILQTLGDYGDRTKNTVLLTENVRISLARTISQQYRDNNRVIHVVTVDPTLENVIMGGLDFNEISLNVTLSQQIRDAIVQAMVPELERLVAAGFPPVVLCDPRIRAGLKQITSHQLPKLAVISHSEITRDTDVEAHGQLSVAALQEAVSA